VVLGRVWGIATRVEVVDYRNKTLFFWKTCQNHDYPFGLKKLNSILSQALGKLNTRVARGSQNNNVKMDKTRETKRIKRFFLETISDFRQNRYFPIDGGKKFIRL